MQAVSMLPARKGVRQGWTIKAPTCARRAACDLSRKVFAHIGQSSLVMAACTFSCQCPTSQLTQWDYDKKLQC